MHPLNNKRSSSVSPGFTTKRSSSVSPLDGSSGKRISRTPRCNSVPFDLTVESNSAKWGRLDSKFRRRWTTFQFLLLTFNSIGTPMGLWVMTKTNIGMVIMDIIVDIAFVIDTILRFQFEYIDEDSMESVAEKKKIRKHYIHSLEFKVGVLSTLSILFSVILLAVDPENPIFIQFDLLRLIRLYLFKDVIMYFKHQILRKHGSLNESLFRMGLIFFVTIQCIIVGGCFYFYIGCPLKHKCKKSSWVDADSLTGLSLASRFLRATHFMTQTLITIGYGDAVIPVSVEEVIFTCIFIVTGLFLYSLILANMTSVLANLDVVGMRFRNEIENLKSYLGMRAIPADQQREVKQYFDYCYAKQGGMLESEIINPLPKQLQREIVLNFKQYVEAIPFFSPDFRSDEFVSEITSQLECRMYTPGSVIVQPHTFLKEIMILQAGRIDVINVSQRQSLWSMVPGDYLGDYQTLFGGPFQWQAVSVMLSDMLILSRMAIHRVLNAPRFASLRSSKDCGVDKTLCAHRDLQEKLSRLQRTITQNPQAILGTLNTSTRDPRQYLEVDSDDDHFLIYPDSTFHLFWDSACIILSLYLALQIPLRLVLYHQRRGDRFFFPLELIVDYMVDLFFIIDAFLNMWVFAIQDLDQANLIITDKKEMLFRYFSSFRFKMDLLSCFPYDVVGLVAGQFIYLRLFHSWRLFVLPLYLLNLAKHLEKCKGLEISTTTLTIANMVTATLLATHWTSCFWSLVHSDGQDLLGAWYWTFTTFTTVGYGDITPVSLSGTVFTIIVGGLGAVFWAGIIANITNFIQSIEVFDTNVSHRRKSMARFLMKQRVLNEETRTVQRERTSQYFDLLEHDYEGIDEQVFLHKALPTHLRQDMLYSLTRDLLDNCPMFREMGYPMKYAVAQHLEQQFYPKAGVVCRFRPPVLGMSFIKRGSVTLHEATAMNTRKILYEGMYFYRQAVLEHWESNPFQVLARTNVELFLLKRATFQRLLDEQPESRRNVDLKKSLMLSPTENLAPKTNLNGGEHRKQTCIDPQSDLFQKLAKKPKYLLIPGDDRSYLWNSIVLTFTLYNWIAIPYRIGFCFDCQFDYTISAAYFGDVIFLLDIVFHGFIQSFQKVDEIETSRKRIFQRYYRSGRIWIHVLAVLPLEAFFGLVHSDHFSPVQILSLLRLNRLCRVMDFTELVPALQKWLLTRFGMHNNTMRVIKLMSVIILGAHVFGCIFFLLAAYNWHWHQDCNTWAGSNGLLEGCNAAEGLCEGRECYVTISVQYVYALYWSMATLTTVGYGDISAVSSTEIVFGIFALIMGTLIFTLAVAYLTDIITQMDVTQTLFKNQVDRFNLYCRLMELPPPVVGAVEKYSHQLWSEFQGVPPTKLLNYLPRNLKQSLTWHMAGSYLENTYFLKDHLDLVKEVAGALKLELCLNEQKIFTTGEPADVLFVLVVGSVGLVNADSGTKYTTLEKCVIGEAEFFSRDVHPCNGVCQSQSQIFMLDFEDFWEFLSECGMTNAFYKYVKKSSETLEKISTKKFIGKLTDNLQKGKLQRMMTAVVKTQSEGIVFEPDSNFVRIWNVVALCISLYYICSIPVAIAFPHNIQIWQVCIDAIFDSFFYVDIYMNLRHFAVEVEGLLIKKREEFSRRYSSIKGRLIVDVMSSLPISLIAYLAGVSRSHPEIFGLLRLPQLLRTKRVVLYGTVTMQWLQEVTNITIRTKVARVNRIFLSILMVTHYVSCAYLFLGRIEHAAGHENWMEANGISETNENTKYLISFYWSLYTLTTVGYGNISVVSFVEHIFAIVCMVVGSILFDAGMVAVLTSIIEDSDYEAGTYQRQLKCMEKYMLKSNFDEGLASVVFKFYQYTKNHQAHTIEKQVHSELSYCLRRTINRFLCTDHLRRSEVFRNFNDGLLNALVFKMKLYVALPEEILLDSSKPSEELYVLQEGACRISHSMDGSGVRGTPLLKGSLICSLKEIHLDGFGVCGLKHQLTLIAAEGLAEFDSKLCERIVEINFLGGSFRSSARSPSSSVLWNEEYAINIRPDDIIQASIYDVLLEDRRENFVGKASIPVRSCCGNSATSFPLFSRYGEELGQLRVQLDQEEDPEEDLVTKIACRTFCHLYKLEFEDIVRVLKYAQNLSVPIYNRLPPRKTAIEYLPILKAPSSFELEQVNPEFTILSYDSELEESVMNKFSSAMSGVGRRLSGLRRSFISRRASLGKSLRSSGKSLRSSGKWTRPPSLNVNGVNKSSGLGTPASARKLYNHSRSSLQPSPTFSLTSNKSRSRQVSQSDSRVSHSSSERSFVSVKSMSSEIEPKQCLLNSTPESSGVHNPKPTMISNCDASDEELKDWVRQKTNSGGYNALNSSEDEIRPPENFVEKSPLAQTSQKIKLTPLKTLRKLNIRELEESKLDIADQLETPGTKIVELISPLVEESLFPPNSPPGATIPSKHAPIFSIGGNGSRGSVSTHSTNSVIDCDEHQIVNPLIDRSGISTHRTNSEIEHRFQM